MDCSPEEELTGKSLVFLISQPRAGSTLLQRMLGVHPQIHTVSEPWLMLHPLYALRADGYSADYDATIAQQAVRGFLEEMPDGEDRYFEGLRRMYTYLYGCALAESGKQYFLDKTPRYYLIIPELHRLFPRASHILLLRNPLAVLCSMLTTWVRESWLSIHSLRHDLLRAPDLLLEGARLLGDQGQIVHYEQLVENPEHEVQRICKGLNVKFAPSMIQYGQEVLPRWRFGDQKTVFEQVQPDLKLAVAWQSTLEDPQTWRLVSDYLDWLGKERVEAMGYGFEALGEVLEAHRPRRTRVIPTFSLSWLLEKPEVDRSAWARGVVWLKGHIRQKGFRGTLAVAWRRAVRALPIRP